MLPGLYFIPNKFFYRQGVAERRPLFDSPNLLLRRSLLDTHLITLFNQ